MLTEKQKFQLTWLSNNPQSECCWMRNGKVAYGDSRLWDAMKISGKQGSIIIPSDDWEAIKPFREAAPYESSKIFQPNEAGRSALAITSPKFEKP